MRPSAEIGSEKITRSTRVARAKDTRSSMVPSLGTPAQLVGLRSSPRSSKAPMMCTSESRCAASERISDFTVAVAADDHGAAVEPALLRPAADQKEQAAAEGDQGEQPEHIKRAEPGAGELVAGLGEERNADGDEKHHGPRRGEPHILLLMPAEGLDLIDVGHLERQHRKQRDAEDGGEIIPGEAVSRHHVTNIDGEADGDDQSNLDGANQSGQHDRRIGRLVVLFGQRLRGGGKLPRLGRRGRRFAAPPRRRTKPPKRCRKWCWAQAWTWWCAFTAAIKARGMPAGTRSRRR